MSNSTELLDQTATHIQKNILLSIRLNNSKMNYVLRIMCYGNIYTHFYISKVIYVNSLLRPFFEGGFYIVQFCLYGTKNYKAVLTPPIVFFCLSCTHSRIQTNHFCNPGQRKLYILQGNMIIMELRINLKGCRC